MEQSQVSLESFLKNVETLPLHAQKETLAKGIDLLVRQQLQIQTRTSSSTVAIPGTRPLHEHELESTTEFIEKTLHTLKTRLTELETIPTKEALEQLLHEAMHKDTEQEKGIALLTFFKTGLRFHSPEALREIISTEPTFNLDAPLHIGFESEPEPHYIPCGTVSETLLTMAVQTQDQQLIRLLHDLGANMNGANGTGWTPLTLAVTNKKPEIVLLLKEMGADLHTINRRGRTPLIQAIIDQNKDMVRALKGLGADINAQAVIPRTPLTFAISFSTPAMVTFLTEEIGADINREDGTGWTPLTWAVEHKKPEMVRTVLALKAEINKKDGTGRTALTQAIAGKDPEMVRLLKEAGANINGIGIQEHTPLTFAVVNKDPEMVRLLLALGADINAIGDTFNPLCLAKLKNYQSMIDLLIESHADQRLATQLANINITAHLTGLYGTVVIKDSHGQDHTIKLEGGNQEFATHHLFENICSFFSSSILPQEELPQEAREHIKTILHDTDQSSNDPESCSNQDIASKIRQGETVAISSGWKGHAISLVFADNKIFICNRGEGSKKQAIMTYQCTSTSVTEDFISQIRNKRFANSQEFDAMIQQQGSIGPVMPEECFDMRRQKAGNCSWANTKPIVHILLYLELKRTRPALSPRELHKEAHTIYKRWSLQVRIEATKKYAESPIEEIIPEIVTKLIEKTVSSRSLTPRQKHELVTILEQKKTDLLERAGQHFPDTNEIKALREAQASHDISSLQKLLWDAYSRNNRILVQKILDIYRPEDLPQLRRIALQIALKNTDLLMIQRLESGADINQREEGSETLLTLAVNNKDPLLVLILHKLGANINSTNRHDRSLLNCAVLNNDQDMVQTLITLGADINRTDGQNWTPLTFAALLLNQEMIYCLHELGANINGVDGGGRTALSLAQQHQDAELIQTLKKFGAE